MAVQPPPPQGFIMHSSGSMRKVPKNHRKRGSLVDLMSFGRK
jgi:hypothetical protein